MYKSILGEWTDPSTKGRAISRPAEGVRQLSFELAMEMDDQYDEQEFGSPFEAVEARAAQIGDMLLREIAIQRHRLANLAPPAAEANCPDCQQACQHTGLRRKKLKTICGEIEFDEANNLARSAGVELSDLAAAPRPLAKITKDKVKLLDYRERGEDPELGISGANGSKPTVIDTLHGLLWRANYRREDVPSYLDEARVDSDKLRNVAQALQGRALRGEGEDKPPEAQACERLLGAWRALVDDNLMRS